MSGTARAGVVVTLLVLGLALTPTGAAQAPPGSLTAPSGDLFLLDDGTLAAEAAGEMTPCVAASENPGAPEPSGEFSTSITNGSYYPIADEIAIDFHLSASSGPMQSAVVGGGFEISATLVIGGTTLEGSFVAGPDDGPTLQAARVTFTVGENATSGEGPITLSITMSAEGGAVPVLPATDAAIVCNSGNAPETKVNDFPYARGQIGEGDLDGDGVPDSEDDDRDGDGVPNAQEEGLTCASMEGEPNFADDAELQPGEDADSDGDGQSDEFECANEANPQSGGSVVPEPARFPWLLLILLLVILILIGAIVFLFLKYGKVVDLTVVSSPELIIQAGKLGKFELAAESRRTKGEPVTLQIAVEGMPEGWDARTEVDHVTVEPQGTDGARKTFFLSVEAPEHEDPESAVVTVKAIPLNKQGRKDTFKLASKAQTVTSINVPPDARVPVKRGGPIKLKTPEEEVGPEGIPIPSEGLPVEDIPGVGPAQAKKLKAEGVETTEALRTADAAELAKKTKIGESDIQRWQRVSDLIRVPGLTPDYGDVLVEAGYDSTAKLADAKPEEIEEKVNAKATPPATADLDMEVA